MPDDTSVGMMTLRLSYFFFVFLAIWIALQPVHKVIASTTSVALMAIHFTMLFAIHQPMISNLNKEVEKVNIAGKVIKPNSVVMAADYTGDWLRFHFADYMGMDKPLVILANNEANAGWFAITWNDNTIPHICLGGKDSTACNYTLPCIASNKTKAIDYVFIYGAYKDIPKTNDWITTNEILHRYYTLSYTAPGEDIHIYSLK